MRLIDQLAANRLYYHRPLATLPDILLIDIPPRFAGPGLALDRYYPVIFESLAEVHEFEVFLCEPRAALVPPALLDRRPSAMRADHIVVARYRPPDPHWPWLQLCCWPARYKAMVREAGAAFARGAYTVDAFVSADDIDAAELRLHTALGCQRARDIRWMSDTAGHA
ncbi:MAG: hypothetical protein WBL20_05220 [Sphingobium sp.]|uniref:hypothetical protein n=1 Tax=Sphingobium sp. TaxID=1912891 RepID=UPI003BB13E69